MLVTVNFVPDSDQWGPVYVPVYLSFLLEVKSSSRTKRRPPTVGPQEELRSKRICVALFLFITKHDKTFCYDSTCITRSLLTQNAKNRVNNIYTTNDLLVFSSDLCL